MLVTHDTVKAGDRVLVLGASGGVGTGCVILAKLLGAEVIACASSADKLRAPQGYRRRRGDQLPDGRFLEMGGRAIRQAAAAIV